MKLTIFLIGAQSEIGDFGPNRWTYKYLYWLAFSVQLAAVKTVIQKIYLHNKHRKLTVYNSIHTGNSAPLFKITNFLEMKYVRGKVK